MKLTKKQLEKLIKKSSVSQYVTTDNNGSVLDVDALFKRINKKLKAFATLKKNDVDRPEHPVLKPCPFCGTIPTEEDVGEYFVACPGCGVDGPASPIDSRASAKDTWNARVLL